MLAPWPMPCHITRLLAAVALMMVAAVAETPSDPTIGSFFTPMTNTLNLRTLGYCGGAVLGKKPSDPTIGSFCTPMRSTLTLTTFGDCGGDVLGQETHLTRLSAPTVPNCG